MAPIGETNVDLHQYVATKQVLSLKELPSFMLDWLEGHGSDTISIWDESGYLLFVAKSIEKILGYKREQLIGTHWLDLLASESDQKKYQSIPEKINDGGETTTFEINLLDQQQNYVCCELETEKLVDSYNLRTYYVVIITDISDRKETENIMVSYEKMSIAGQLAAGVAHEIRNPLTSLKGFLQLLQAGTVQKEAYYKIMIDEIKKMEQITSELLYISKPLTDYRQDENLSEMIKDIIHLLHPQANAKKVNVVYDLQDSLRLYCDRSQIKQVLINIVKNAIEAMEVSGTIYVTTFLNDEEKIVISIKDEGPGIDESIIHKLGEPFFTTKHNGTGLGIMVTKQILDRHHATLQIMNNINEKGCTFKMTFEKQDF